MSNNTSQTGLLASPTKTVSRKLKKKTIHLKAQAFPAPISLRPYAGLYNPYPFGCSLLCNHPTDKEARDVLKRARETWATENKNVILPNEIQAIRDSLAYVDDSIKLPPPIDNIPEELFRRYTETDSRPLTPAPTLASVKTRGSSSRRCVTPDPITTSVLRERTLLILDLRRSHSQEILSWHETNDPPLINILQPPTPTISIESTVESPDTNKKSTLRSQKSEEKPSPKRQQKLEVPKTQPAAQQQHQSKVDQNKSDNEDSEGEEEVVKRKGKRRKKRGRDSSRGPLAVQASVDPETQVATIDSENYIPNTQNTVISERTNQEGGDCINTQTPQQRENELEANAFSKSILGPKILKHLQRELTSEIIDMEPDEIRKAMLQEAFNTLPKQKKPPCEEIIKLQKELKLLPINTDTWLTLPRVFSRKSARFELPLHSRILTTLTPIEYLRNHVMVSKGRKVLFNIVFNRNKDEDVEDKRILKNDRLQIALGEMMGQKTDEDQMNAFKDLIDWKNNLIIDFKTWCGICALFERIFAKDFCSKLPGKEIDPCNEVEVADFQSLTRRLQKITANQKLIRMLKIISES